MGHRLGKFFRDHWAGLTKSILAARVGRLPKFFFGALFVVSLLAGFLGFLVFYALTTGSYTSLNVLVYLMPVVNCLYPLIAVTLLMMFLWKYPRHAWSRVWGGDVNLRVTLTPWEERYHAAMAPALFGPLIGFGPVVIAFLLGAGYFTAHFFGELHGRSWYGGRAEEVGAFINIMTPSLIFLFQMYSLAIMIVYTVTRRLMIRVEAGPQIMSLLRALMPFILPTLIFLAYFIFCCYLPIRYDTSGGSQFWQFYTWSIVGAGAMMLVATYNIAREDMDLSRAHLFQPEN